MTIVNQRYSEQQSIESNTTSGLISKSKDEDNLVKITEVINQKIDNKLIKYRPIISQNSVIEYMHNHEEQNEVSLLEQ